MRVSFVTLGNMALASYRYRNVAIANQMVEKGVQVTVDRVAHHEADVVIFGKHWTANDYTYALLCKERGQKVVYDICDNHFENEKLKNHYLRMSKVADAITVNSPAMGATVKVYTDRSATIIDDPVLGVTQPFTQGPVSLCWYGSKANLQGLFEVYNPSSEIPLEIACPVDPSQLPRAYHAPWIRFSPWNPDIISELGTRHSIALIPYRQGKLEKSANRVIEAINAGMWVIADMIPSVIGIPGVWDLSHGLNRAIDTYNANDLKPFVEKGQKYVKEHFGLDVITQKWIDFCEELKNET